MGGGATGIFHVSTLVHVHHSLWHCVWLQNIDQIILCWNKSTELCFSNSFLSFSFFISVSQPIKIISLILSQINRKVG